MGADDEPITKWADERLIRQTIYTRFSKLNFVTL